MAKGKRYDEELKKETVKYVLENNKPVAQVARGIDMNEKILHSWVKNMEDSRK